MTPSFPSLRASTINSALRAVIARYPVVRDLVVVQSWHVMKIRAAIIAACTITPAIAAIPPMDEMRMPNNPSDMATMVSPRTCPAKHYDRLRR